MSAQEAAALARFRGLVDARTGVIRTVDLLRITERDPRVFMAHADPCDTTPLFGIEASNRGVACSATPERAIIRACGESVERYCSAVFDTDAMPLATYEDIVAGGDRAVAVQDLYPFDDAQRDDPAFPYDDPRGRELRWVRGHVWHGSEEVWVPASCVYVPYRFDREVEPFTHMPISTGLAAGPDPEWCVRKGVLEILERDALMIVWYARLAVPRIDPESCRGVSPTCDALLDAIWAQRSRWELNLLTVDVAVPIVSAAIVDPDGPQPLTSFGIAADPDPARALMLAMEEALLTRVLVNRSELSDDAGAQPIRTLRDHLLVHAASRDLRERMRFLTTDGPSIDFAEIAGRLPQGDLAERVADAGFEVIWHDVTSPDVAEHGLCTTRALMAGAQPLDNDHRFRHLGGRRLLDVPRALGHPVSMHELNPDPHPFP